TSGCTSLTAGPGSAITSTPQPREENTMQAASFAAALACARVVQGQVIDQDKAKQPPPWKSAPQKIEGAWTVVYVEIEGKKVPENTLSHVVIKDNVLHFRHGGKDESYKLEFGPYHMLKATALTGKEAAAEAVKGGKEPI